MPSIRKRGNSYQITVSNGRDVYGRQQIETKTFVPDPGKTDKQNEKALQLFALEFEKEVKSGKYLDGEKITFQAFAERWMKECAAAQLEPSTIEFYRRQLETHVIPAIGNVKLSKIQPAAINRLYTDMLTKRKDGKPGGYAPSTIKHCHATISTILNTAMRWNIIQENPCNRVSVPKRKNMQSENFFTPSQASEFLAYLDEKVLKHELPTQYKLFFHMAIFGGLRRGELVALLWSDIDIENMTVDITKSTCVVDGKPFTKPPKNNTSERTISLPGHIKDILIAYRKEYTVYKKSLGSKWQQREDKEEYIFINWNGAQIYPATPYRVFRQILIRYNEEHEEKLPMITLHGLRHTSATLLIGENVDIKTVSNRLGHAQTSTTMNIYSHALQKLDRKAADALENLLGKR